MDPNVALPHDLPVSPDLFELAAFFVSVGLFGMTCMQTYVRVMISLDACSLRVGLSAIGSHTFCSKPSSDITPRLDLIPICSHYKRDKMYLRGLVSFTCDIFTFPRSSMFRLGDLPLVIHHCPFLPLSRRSSPNCL